MMVFYCSISNCERAKKMAGGTQINCFNDKDVCVYWAAAIHPNSKGLKKHLHILCWLVFFFFYEHF